MLHAHEPILMQTMFLLFDSDFCKKELIEQSFARKVARLNTNILYLCYTQRVKLNTLSPSHTLENIEKLLNLEYSDLGRIGAVDISDSFSGTMDFVSAGDSGSEEGNQVVFISTDSQQGICETKIYTFQTRMLCPRNGKPFRIHIIRRKLSFPRNCKIHSRRQA